MRTERGLSELTGAVILIAITLIVGAVLYGLYFSGQGTTQGAASTLGSVANSVVNNQQANNYYSSPQVTVVQVSCSNADGACTIQLMNTGGSDATAYSCSVGGASGVLSPSPATVTAGVTTTITCATQSGQGAGPGSPASGEIGLNGGSPLPFAGTWQ